MDLNVLVCGMHSEFATKRVLQHLDKEMIPYKFVEVSREFFDGMSPTCYIIDKGQFYFTNGVKESLGHIKNSYKAIKNKRPISHA